MKRALITGITGFTGRYLADELAKAGYEVFGTARHVEPADRNVFVCDLGNREDLARIITETRPDVVAHLAAISFVAHGNSETIYRVNLLGTLNLLQALADAGVIPHKVLLASSANVYGNAQVEPIDEAVPVAPVNDYAVSKMAMEQMARLWFDKFPIVITRPFNYTGVGQAPHFLLPKIVSHFARHAQEIELGNLAVARDFSDVRRVAMVYRRLLESPADSEIFNVCSGLGYSLQDVLDRMSHIAGYSIKVNVNPAFVRANEVKRLVGSMEKLCGAIGEFPVNPLEETLHWMYERAHSDVSVQSPTPMKGGG
ncbi:MAG: GDP-mannose 4,6-dehydratase [Methylococcaceae bacterium]|nr:GDP-mannose 4,6-dehydratase [Methylococcaceae bacterium]